MKSFGFVLVVVMSVGSGGLLSACQRDLATPSTPMDPSLAANGATTNRESAVASIVSIELGSEIGPDYEVSERLSSFSANQTVYVSTLLAVSDARSRIPGKLTVQWTNLDVKRVVKEESKALEIANSNRLNLALVAADGMVPGRYSVRVSLEGGNSKTETFEVK